MLSFCWAVSVVDEVVVEALLFVVPELEVFAELFVFVFEVLEVFVFEVFVLVGETTAG